MLLLLLAACDPTGTAVIPDDTGEAVVDTDTPVGDTDAPEEEEEPPPPPPTVRFVALGDAGTGSEAQHAVGAAIAELCARPDRGCDFALYLGDNVYDSGVDSNQDERFLTHFELPYEALDFPFYAVLGNHDLGGGGLGVDLDFDKAEYQIEYSDYSDKWDMEAEFYAIPDYKVPSQPARFYALNTTDIFFGWNVDTQRTFLDFETQTSPSTWNIAFGHHPYISNGQHGNAGEYEGIDEDIPFTEIPRGQNVKEFVEDTMCDGQVDLYLSGHDHNRQWLGQAEGCSTYFAVTGAGGKTSDFRHDGNPTLFQDDQEPGFLWVEIAGETLTAYFYDADLDEAGPFVIEK